MARTTMTIAVLFLCSGLLLAQDDGFGRERRGEQGKAKDALEGKAPPALRVTDWLNTKGKKLKLSDLEGKVVVLDFWGTW